MLKRMSRLGGLVAVLAVVGSGVGVQVGAQERAQFQVGPGYLSASVRELVSQHGWELVWKSEEDRQVEFPFEISIRGDSSEAALREALEALLEAYDGAFVADMYRSNKVVTVDTAPPQVAAVRPIVLSAGAGTEGAPAGEPQPEAAPADAE